MGNPTRMANENGAPVQGRPCHFNASWRFQQGEADAFRPEVDDSSWRVVDLPHDWSIEGPFDESLTSATAYLPGGIAWYRKRFTLKEIGYTPGKRVRIRFDGVYNHSTVWCNGTLLGSRPYGYSTFSYDVTDSLVPGDAEQIIAVRVDHREFSDSRWYTGSGIYRNVWVTVSDPVHVIEDGVFVQTPAVSSAQAEVRIETTVANESDSATRILLCSHVTDAAGVEVGYVESRRLLEAGEDALFAQTTQVINPTLWSPDTPALYRVHTVVRQEAESAAVAGSTDSGAPAELVNGIPVVKVAATDPSHQYESSTILDARVTPFGIRYFAFHPADGFTLNGVAMKMKGVCIHHDAGCFGAAVPQKVWARRLRLLKESGCNAIRFSHNPPAPELIDLCDTMGFLTMDEAFDEWEATKNKWVFGHNQGAPSRQGYGDDFAEWAEADLRAMVLRDRNHPSIVFWSIGNEIDYPNDPWTHPVLGERYKPDHPHSDRLGVMAGKLGAIVRSLDTTRPITSALADVNISNRTGFADALDVVGYNYLERHYADDHKTYPHRVIYGSENGQSLEAWAAVRDNPYISGQFLWTGIDFLGEARGWPVRNSQAGYLDIAGFRKPSFHFRRSLWTDEPMVWIGVLPPGTETDPKPRRGWGEVPSWNWPGADGTMVTVMCHTTCESVELSLNGKSLGMRRPEESEHSLLRWEVPYQSGSLTAIGYRDGQVVCTAGLKTSGKPNRISAVYGPDAGCENAFLRGDGNDLIHAELTVVDAQGVPVYDADHSLSFAVEGPGKIIGLENGDPASHEVYGTDTRKVFCGKLLVVVGSTGGAGTVTVRVTGDGLAPLSIEIPCV